MKKDNKRNHKTNQIRRRYNRIAAVYDFVEIPMEYVLSSWRQDLIKFVMAILDPLPVSIYGAHINRRMVKKQGLNI
ncbi:hypothetical protein GF407_14395 [candidate division KSB1 bacterium]|nr:hypothetical protein [candidate division KSB1 bacterium]